MKKYNLFVVDNVCGKVQAKCLGLCRDIQEAEAMVIRTLAKKETINPEHVLMVPTANLRHYQEPLLVG